MQVGFEIEIEDVVDFPKTIPGINIENDGSLRNGMEFVSYICPDTDFASMLYEYLFKKVKGTYSERCGIHFHMDFVNKSVEEIIDFVSRYLTIEKTLFKKYSSVLRENNSFCNLLLNSPSELDIIRTVNYEKNTNTFSNFSKYTALNLKPLYYQSTIEFRALAGGTSPDLFSEILFIFEELYNGNTPNLGTISEEDRVEAESVITLLSTEVVEDTSGLGEYFEKHFCTNETVLTKETIENYLRGQQDV